MSKRPRKILGLTTLLCILTPSGTYAELDPLVAPREDRVAYAMGLLHARELRALSLTEVEFALYAEGLGAGFGGEPKLQLNEWLGAVLESRRGRQQARRVRELRATEQFLAYAEAEAGAERLPSGLIFTRLKPGSGASPAPDATLTIHYHGTLRDGLVVESSLDHGEPRRISLPRSLPCWQDALPRMRVGERAKLVCPPALAYGDEPASALIPPAAVVTYEMELISIP